MTLKEKITSKFDKSLFKIDPMGVETGIDPGIKDFILKLNVSKEISTLYSCEGHGLGDHAYIYFNLSEDGWEIFWNKVIPELSEKLLIDKGWCLHQVNWTVGIKSNQYNTGINISFNLEESNHFPSWEDAKTFFWKTLEETFLKFFLEV